MAGANSQFKIRHYIPETDLPPLARLLKETEAFDRDGEETSEEYLRSALGWPNFRPAQDAWVVEMGGTPRRLWDCARAALPALYTICRCPSIPTLQGAWKPIT